MTDSATFDAWWRSKQWHLLPRIDLARVAFEAGRASRPPAPAGERENAAHSLRQYADWFDQCTEANGWLPDEATKAALRAERLREIAALLSHPESERSPPVPYGKHRLRGGWCVDCGSPRWAIETGLDECTPAAPQTEKTDGQ